MHDDSKLTEIAKKIKKLLALSESSNADEAALAAEKARELLEKYNMTLTDAEIKSSEMANDDFRIYHNSKQYPDWFYQKHPRWLMGLHNVMSRYFYVRVLYSGSGFMIYLGAKTDVEVAKYIVQYLVHEIERLADDYLKKYRGSGISEMKNLRASFCIGVVQGIRHKLESEKAKETPAKTSSGTELIVIKDAVLNEYLKQQYPHTRELKSSSRLGHRNDAREKGFEQGKNIHIKHGVTSDSSQKTLK